MACASGKGERTGHPDVPFPPPILLYFPFFTAERDQGEFNFAALNTYRLICNENIAVVIKSKQSTLTPSINVAAKGQGETWQPSREPMTFPR